MCEWSVNDWSKSYSILPSVDPLATLLGQEAYFYYVFYEQVRRVIGHKPVMFGEDWGWLRMQNSWPLHDRCNLLSLVCEKLLKLTWNGVSTFLLTKAWNGLSTYFIDKLLGMVFRHIFINKILEMVFWCVFIDKILETVFRCIFIDRILETVFRRILVIKINYRLSCDFFLWNFSCCN